MEDLPESEIEPIGGEIVESMNIVIIEWLILLMLIMLLLMMIGIRFEVFVNKVIFQVLLLYLAERRVENFIE